eukprot:342963-Ditylum_brightwellii.AAC.1
MLRRDPQATQLPRPSFKATQHVFPEKAGQIQKHYMQRNLRLVRGMTMKEWVAQVSKLNGYLKDFPAHNRNHI